MITRGWIYAEEAEDLLDEMRKVVAEQVLGRCRRATTRSSASSGWCARRRASS
ncbi:MAG: hypothetical protein R2702_00110 [Acidimicrobiales bacterium]